MENLLLQFQEPTHLRISAKIVCSSISNDIKNLITLIEFYSTLFYLHIQTI